MLKFLNILFSNKKKHTLTFKKKFQYFQALLSANDDAHKYLSELGEILLSGKHFSKGQVTKLFHGLAGRTEFICKQLILLSNGKYIDLLDKFKEIESNSSKLLNAHVYCPIGWNCKDMNCSDCKEQQNLPESQPYFINLYDAGSSNEILIGSKMSRLGEIRHLPGINIPDGFCLTVRLFEDIMLNDNIREKKNKIFYDVDFQDLSEVQKACVQAQQLILSSGLPPHIEEIILKAYEDTFGSEPNVKLAVRSSARGEDSAHYSFAGLHRTELNIGKSNLIDAVIEVLISKYSLESVIYRYYTGLRDEDMPMSVGCIRMINSQCGGVLFTADPSGKHDGIIIQAVRGLGSIVVEGKAQPQEYLVEHSREAELISFKPGQQVFKTIPNVSDGLAKVSIMPHLSIEPCLQSENIKELVNVAITIEEYFNYPQDIEWSIDSNGKLYILQTRPLIFEKEHINEKSLNYDIKDLDKKYEILFNGGECASRGVAHGKVFVIDKLKDIKEFPKGAILVAKRNIPEFASLIHKLSAVITNIGSTTGHLSIIARESGIPVLTNTVNAASILKTGDEITVFTDEKRVYKGKVEEIMDLFKSSTYEDDSFMNSPLYRIWHSMTKFIFKLNLTKMNVPNFAPNYCETIHDVIRFSHESAMREMFSLYENSQDSNSDTHHLKFEIPLDIYMIDLGNGLKECNSINVTTEYILSEPFLALIKGWKSPGIRWGGPLPVDFKGFANIMYTNINDASKTERNIGSRSYALISRDYLNFFSRLGYHFSRLDALASDEIHSNYINFHFRGGAADFTRRVRRATAIRRILESLNFTAFRNDDNVVAKIMNVDKESILNLLCEVGRLMGAIRNTDVTMLNDKNIDEFVQYFLEGDSAPALRLSK
ncbi:MAG: hypothetical protein HW421_3043 [Ignavibacteria bacterium]|nr:hypothetical protein [Ignavibacteria bacterium]